MPPLRGRLREPRVLPSPLAPRNWLLHARIGGQGGAPARHVMSRVPRRRHQTQSVYVVRRHRHRCHWLKTVDSVDFRPQKVSFLAFPAKKAILPRKNGRMFKNGREIKEKSEPAFPRRRFGFRRFVQLFSLVFVSCADFVCFAQITPCFFASIDI